MKISYNQAIAKLNELVTIDNANQTINCAKSIKSMTNKTREQLTDELVNSIKKEHLDLNAELQTIKQSEFVRIKKHIELLKSYYGVKVGIKGNIEFKRSDGKYKVALTVQEFIDFDERLAIAKGLIDECLKEWSNGSNEHLIEVVNSAFRVGKTNKVSTHKIVELCRLKIKHAKWEQAMNLIKDATHKKGSKDYIRLYERTGDFWQFIPLDIAKV